MNLNGKEYAVERLSITATLLFVPEVLEAIGPSIGGILDAFNDGVSKDEVFKNLFSGVQSAKLSAIMRKSLNQCITPENTYLKDANIFEKWFMEHPEDLFQLAGLATWELVHRFLPQALATKASGFLSKAKV